MSEEISGVSAISSDSSSRTEQSRSASEVQRQSEAQQSQKAEQPKETSATINENDRAELSATREEESQAHAGTETSGLAGRIAGAWSDPEEADGVKGVKATDETDETGETGETEKTGKSSAEAAKSVGANSAEGYKGQSKSLGEKILDKAGDIANTVLKKISGLINGESSGKTENIDECKATDGIKDSATVDMLKEVPGYEELLNETYENAVPEVKALYEKYEGQIKLSDADLMTSKELNKFNNDFADTVSKTINEAKKANEDGNASESNTPTNGISDLLAVAKEKNNIKTLLSDAQKPVNDGDADGQAKKAQAIEDLTSKLTEAYGDDIDGLKAAVIDNIASTGYNTDKIASAGSVEEIVNALSSLSSEGSYYTHGSRSVYLDVPSDMNDKVPPGRTYFHEVGHLMDDAAFTLDDNKLYQKTGDDRRMMSDNYEFREAIENDFQNYVDNYKKEHKDEISHITKYCEGYDVTASDKDKVINDYIQNLDPEIREKYSTEDIVTYRLIRDMMMENIPKEENGGKTNIELYETTSDIFGGLTDNICRGVWGHSNDYWNGSDSAITSEMFAHMFQTSMNNDEELQKLKEIFPTSYDKFMEMVKQAS